jgi:hypothetical protein
VISSDSVEEAVLKGDFVMLDKYWEEQVRRMRERLARASIENPLAQVISKRSGGAIMLHMAIIFRNRSV